MNSYIATIQVNPNLPVTQVIIQANHFQIDDGIALFLDGRNITAAIRNFVTITKLPEVVAEDTGESV